MYVGLHGKQPVMKLEFSRNISEKFSNIKVNKNLSGEGGDLCHAGGRTDRQTDMTKQIVIFCIVANSRNTTIANSDTAVELIDFTL
jgi:hypothetical protein